MKSTRAAAIVLSISLLAPMSSASALEGLARLQELAKRDQDCECMIHEYTRRYNEVLRKYGQEKLPLTEDRQALAHDEAMQWVRSVWQNADQKIVNERLSSEAFQSATTVFRRSQKLSYPHLAVVP